MKITMTIRPSYDNEIRFYDACYAAAARLHELGKKALEEGDCEQLVGTYDVIEENDDAETIGEIKVRS